MGEKSVRQITNDDIFRLLDGKLSDPGETDVILTAISADPIIAAFANSIIAAKESDFREDCYWEERDVHDPFYEFYPRTLQPIFMAIQAIYVENKRITWHSDPKTRELQIELQKWMETNFLTHDSTWWLPEDYYEDQVQEAPPTLILGPDGAIRDVISVPPDMPWYGKLRTEFDVIVRRHDFLFSIDPANPLTHGFWPKTNPASECRPVFRQLSEDLVRNTGFDFPENRISALNSPRLEVATLEQLMNGHKSAQVLDLHNPTEVVRELVVHDDTLTILSGIERVTTPLGTAVTYERRFMDRGDLLFKAANYPGGAKICTEADLIRYPDGSVFSIVPVEDGLKP